MNNILTSYEGVESEQKISYIPRSMNAQGKSCVLMKRCSVHLMCQGGRNFEARRVKMSRRARASLLVSSAVEMHEQETVVSIINSLTFVY